MALCDLNSSIVRLERATKRLRDQWIETKEAWDDSVSRDFEREYLEPLLPHVKLAMTSIHRLAEVFTEAEQECRDRDRDSTDVF